MSDDLKKLGKYDVVRELGKGAMGIVYEGFDPFIERTVALKTIQKSVLDPQDATDMINRFRREAQAAGRLTHPNIVAIYEYGEDGDTSFIAMEFIRGKELKSFFDKEERFQLTDTLRIMSQLLSALEYSHSRGVVHRDIKPANIILMDEDNSVKVADFGIARIESSTLTQVGTVLGTPAYMSPEQFLGQIVDRRSDIYSSGVILYQFLTGEKPFTGSVAAIMHKVMNQMPSPPSALNMSIPKSLDFVVEMAIAKRPEDRFQTAGEFAEALREAVEGEMTANIGAAASPDATVISAAGDMASQPGTSADIDPEELEHWKRLQSSTSIPDLQLYLKKYPDGAFIDLARSKIAALEKNQLERKRQGAQRSQQTEAAAEADSSQTEINFWRSIKSSIDPKDFEAYLKKYPKGHFAELAQLKLDSIGQAEPSGNEQKPATEARVIPAPFVEREAPQAPEKKKFPWAIAAGVTAIAGAGAAWFALSPPSEPQPETAAKTAPISAEAQARADAEKAKQDREKLQKQMADLIKLEQEKLELAKLEREKIEKANLEKEKADKELEEKVKQEQELIAKIREETLKEQERAAKAKLEGERLEKARLEKERLAQEKEKLALEKERLAQDKLAKEKLTSAQIAANAEKLRQEKEKAAKEKAIADKERAVAEKAKLELEKAEQARLAKEKTLRVEQEQALAKLKAEREAAATKAAEAKSRAEAEKAAAKSRAEAEAIAEKKRKLEMEAEKSRQEAAAKAEAEAKAKAATVPAPSAAPTPPPAAPAPSAAPAPGGDASAQYQEGLRLEKEGKLAEAMKQFLAAANGGYGPAMKKVGDIYNKGNAAVPRDYMQSIKWYNRAKKAGVDVPEDIKR